MHSGTPALQCARRLKEFGSNLTNSLHHKSAHIKNRYTIIDYLYSPYHQDVPNLLDSGCFGHTQHLLLSEGLLTLKHVGNILATDS